MSADVKTRYSGGEVLLRYELSQNGIDFNLCRCICGDNDCAVLGAYFDLVTTCHNLCFGDFLRINRLPILIGNGKRETNFVHSIILKKELNIHGSRNALKDDFINNIDIVASGKADVMKMVSGIYDMENATDAFEALKNNDGTLAKILIKIG